MSERDLGKPDAALLSLHLTGLGNDGAGIAMHEDLVVHVAQALPGEDVTAHLVHVSQHRRADGTHEAWANLERVERASPDRVAPVCPGYGNCGGCVLQHLAPEAQRNWKRTQVQSALARFAAPGLAAMEIGPVFASPKPIGYRNQAKYVVGWNEHKRIVLGAYAPRSHRLVDLAGCKLGEPPQDAVAAWLCDALQSAGVAPFDERTRTGSLRYVVMRSNAAGELLVALITARSEFPAGRALAEGLRAAFPGVVGVVHNVNGSAGNVIFGQEEHVLAGLGTINESFSGVPVAMGPRAFLQLNRDVAAAAYDAIRAAVLKDTRPASSRLIDLYSGVGAIAFSLADLADEIVAIEANDAATAAGSRAAVQAGKDHVRFETAEASAALGELDSADVVVLNPPRAGAGASVCASIVRLRPRVVAYLSCDPVTLARDLADLMQSGSGLAIDCVQPFDMLPHTTHVETLVVLRRMLPGVERDDVSGRFPSR